MLVWRVQLEFELYINRQIGGGKPEVEAPHRKPRRPSKLESGTGISEEKSPVLMIGRKGSRDDTTILAWVTGHSGCFLCNEIMIKK